MRINRRPLVAIAILVLLPTAALPWGSLYPAETHQYIIATAFDRLKADPAFAPALFPDFSAIKNHEGVQWTYGDYYLPAMTGVGADGHGMSTYAEHYYNPQTNEGEAPNSVARYYSVLIRDNLLQMKSTAEAGPKAAAYSAHFLADVTVPYHVNGASRATAEKIWVDQRGYETQQITLPQSITGLSVLSYKAPIKGLSHNFYTELSRFVTLTDPPELDWFDPWYYNGNTDALMEKESSHILWEAFPNGEAASTFHARAGQGLDGYDPHWKNAAPTFDSPWVGQAEQARQFTIFQATKTRELQAEYFENPTPALRGAIRAVYTLWRASFSGLRPAIEYQPEANSTAYRVTGKVTNAASAAASNVRARLTTTDCAVVDGKDKSMGSSLAAGKTQTVSASWQVQPTAGKACHLTLEVIATYEIPDLQYSLVERAFTPQPVTQEVSKPTPPEPSQPTNVEDSGATFFLPTCHDPEKEKCKSIEVKGPGIPPGATVHGRWSCGRLWSGSNQLACTCLPDSIQWGPIDCGPRFNGPSFNPPACKYDGLPCGY
jgi:hypothetical protein